MQKLSEELEKSIKYTMDNNNHLLDKFFKNMKSISPLSKEAKEMALPYLKIDIFRPNSPIIDAGDNVVDSYFVLSGIARYFYINDKGKEYNKSFITDGDVLMSFSSFLMQMPSEYFIESLSELVTIKISHKNLKNLTSNSLEWHQLYVSFLEKVLIQKIDRESDLLLLNAKQRYLKFLNNFKEIETLISNYHIASYLGITDVRLSNIRRELHLT